MAILMATRGRFTAPFATVVARVAEEPDESAPADTVLLCRNGRVPECDPTVFAAVLIDSPTGGKAFGRRVGVYDTLDHLKTGDVVQIDGRNGWTRTLYRSDATDNALFITERCDNNCLMCSQPPRNDADDHVDVALRVVELIKNNAPPRLGITGGEPTLVGENFLRLLTILRDDLPETTITALSNGRSFSSVTFADAIGRIGHPNLRFSIPLHADVPDVHDYIAQARGAFVETLSGFYNLAANKVNTEIRVVLQRLSIPRLTSLAEYIARKLPFVRQVAFMGMENMGYVKKNWEQLWIDPLDYGEQLQESIEHLWRRGMDVSVYNLPYCVLPRSVWGFARQSISNHKQILINECRRCEVSSHCSGLFMSSKKRHSRGISAITVLEERICV